MACKKETKRQERKRYREKYSVNDSNNTIKREPKVIKNENNNEIVSQLNAAIKSGNKKIEITYEDKRGNVTIRKVDIYEVTSIHLIGFCNKVFDRRTFLISGIKAVQQK